MIKQKKPKADTAPLLVRSAALTLKKASVEDAALEARLIVAHVLDADIHHMFLDRNLKITVFDKFRMSLLVRRRIAGTPIQYLLRSQDFYGLPFYVDRRVLIPRPETELLVENALSLLPDERQSRILDLCTGSGCVAVALKHNRPDCNVTATDLSRSALRVAKKNADHHKTDICFIHSDLFKKIDGVYDIIVSNPPYIHPGDYQWLEHKVRDYEPRLALVGGEDGLSLIRQIIQSAGSHLVPGGTLMLEIGSDQRDAVAKLLKMHAFIEIKCFSDYAGFDRIIVGKKTDKETPHV